MKNHPVCKTCDHKKIRRNYRDLRRQIGRKIRALRMKQRMPLDRLARRCGLGAETLDRFEMGKNEITLFHIIRIASALDVAVGEIV